MDNWLRISRFIPSYCYLCGQTSPNGTELCHGCGLDLPRIEHACQQCGLPISANSLYARCGQCQVHTPPFERTLSAFIYAEPLKQLITRMKFSGNLSLARLLGQLLRDEIGNRLDARPEAILPVPLHPQRLRHRGFNQAIEIARPLAKQLQIPLLLNAVERRVDTPAQTGLSKQQRQRNLRHAFHIRQDLPYRHIAIVDDVITTTQTVTALAACLGKAGVMRVDCWSVARALPASPKYVSAVATLLKAAKTVGRL